MACMDHECPKCGLMWADNKRASECVRPGCDGEPSNWFDEMPEREDEDEEEKEE